eukprot:12799438-Alexandrium_andersonii.AAC.1
MHVETAEESQTTTPRIANPNCPAPIAKQPSKGRQQRHLQSRDASGAGDGRQQTSLTRCAIVA